MALTVATTLIVDTTQAAVGPVGGPVSIRQASPYEQLYNPFGDPWSTKGGPNPSIPNWLTPVCHRVPQRDGNLVPPADEAAFNAKANLGVLWEECGDPMESSGGNQRNGDPVLKNYIAAVKAINPSIKYIGYFNSAPHSVRSLGAPVTPVGLLDFEPIESYFIHVNDAPVTKANRVKYVDNVSDLYDFTNPQFRQDMAAHIKQSLELHNMDGFVVDGCFDQPLMSGPGPSQAKLAAWAQGCVDLLATLKAAMPNKLIYHTGFRHIGTQTQPSPVNEAAALELYKQKTNVTDGFFWEDPLGPAANVPPNVVRFAVSRFETLRDYALSQNKLMLNVINTNIQGQSSFGTTNATQQRQLERFYLAAQMILSAGAKTPFTFQTPGPVGDKFATDTFYKDWDYNIGNAKGAYTQPQEAVFVREFERGRVVWNWSATPFTVGLTDGTFRTLDGQPVTSFVVGPYSGMIFRGPGADAVPVTPPETTTCSPTRPRVTNTVTKLGNGQLQVDLGTTDGGGYIHSIEITKVTNATVGFQGGQQGITGAFTFQAAAGATTQRLNIQRVGGGAFTVLMTVTDGCGTWKTLAGGGPGVS